MSLRSWLQLGLFSRDSLAGLVYSGGGRVGVVVVLGWCAWVVAPSLVADEDQIQTPPNQAPSFGSATAARSIAENSATGAAIGDPLTATDDRDTALSYSLEGDDADSFAVDASGQLSVGEDVQLDYENRTEYSVTVRATDSAEASATVAVTVTVTDVNDPSIVLIMADDTGYEVYSAYGTTQYSTPRLDAIAAAGTRFTNMFALPACPPTRVALMTGKSNFRNYVNWGTLRNSEYTFGDLFTANGYATAIGGKWQLNLSYPLGSGTPGGAGFDTHCLWHTQLAHGSKSPYWDPVIGCDGELIETDDDDYGPDLLTDFHLQFIEDNRYRPFFAYYPMVLAHSPFVLPPDATCDDSDDRQCVFEKMVERADHNVGRIYDKLQSLGLLDNTILMFTADNGTTGFVSTELDGVTVRGGKATTLDTGTRVPLIAWVPGQSGGRVFDDLIHIADIFPTLADAAGLTIPNRGSLDGVSFWERLQGNEGDPRESLFMFYFPTPYAANFDHALRHPPTLFARDKRYKLYWPNELYDLSVDPHELHPLPEDHEESADARDKLKDVVDDVGYYGEAPYLGLGIAHYLVAGNPRAPRPRRRPILSGAAVNRTQMTLSYVGRLDRASTPDPTDFSVSADSTPISVSSISVNNRSVDLTLSTRVWNGQGVTVSYTPGEAPLQRPDDKTADALEDQPVVNNTPPNQPPAITGPATATVPENTETTTPLATLTATDPDNDPITWTLQGTDRNHFHIHQGTLTFTTPPNHEHPTDTNRNNTYQLELPRFCGRFSV